MHLDSIVSSLRNSHLTEIKLDPEALSLKLNFSFWPSEGMVNIEYRKVVHFSFSKDPEDEEAAYFIMDAFLDIMKDGGRSALDALGFPWRDKDGHAVVDDGQAYHFYTIGDVSLNIVCRELIIIDNPEK